jgi:hypothetical protein
MVALERTAGAIRFSTLAGVESVYVEGDSITGVWKPDLTWRPPPKKNGIAAEDFANWPDSEKAILRFTKRYGPLEDRPIGGKQFRFSIAQWRNDREGIRFLWGIVRLGGDFGSLGKHENGVYRPHINFEGRDRWSIPAQEGDHFAYEHGQLVYRTATLLKFLMLDLLSVPREYLRTCKRPNCPAGFFVADHRREDYCSPECKQWAQRLWKRNWWNEKGKTQRKGRN